MPDGLPVTFAPGALPVHVTNMPAMVISATGGDDSGIVNAALSRGYQVWLGSDISISDQLIITTDKTGIDGKGHTITMSTASGAFDNATYANRFGTSAVGILSEDTDDVFVRNCRITTSAWVDDRYLKAIYFNNCDDTRVTGNEFWGFSRGVGIVTMDDCDRPIIEGNLFRDSYTNSTSGTASEAQITGIEIDGSCDFGSKDGIIRGNIFRNLTMGSAAVTALGYQTDGINLGGTTTKPTLRFVISENVFFNMGEAVDCFGKGNSITGNVMERCFNQGVKLIHGASENLVANNLIRNCGRRGIVVSGSMNAGVGNSDGNCVTGNKIEGVGVAGDWDNADGGLSSSGATTWSGINTCGIHVFGVQNSATYLATNTVISNNDIDCGSGGLYGIVSGEYTGMAGTNVAKNNTIRNASTGNYLDTNNDLIIDGGYRAVGTTTFTIVDNIDYYVFAVGAGCTVTFPSPVYNRGRSITLLTQEAGAIISASSNITPRIGGSAGTAILPATDGAWAIVRSNGAQWRIFMSGV